jgi:hypothetical protein
MLGLVERFWTELELGKWLTLLDDLARADEHLRDGPGTREVELGGSGGGNLARDGDRVADCSALNRVRRLNL